MQERWTVLVARYFIFVGGTLAVLLFIPGWCLPPPRAMFTDRTAIEKAVIRIRSAQKWPDKVVLDTSQPTITPLTVEEPLATQSIRLPSDEAENQSNLEAMAQLNTQPATIDHRTPQIKHGAPRVARSRRVARGPTAKRPEATGGGCCLFGWIESGQTMSNAMPRRRAALHGL
jgi:hypothetical protein